MTFSDGAVAQRVRGRVVSWTYFSLLGIQPALGSAIYRSGRTSGQSAGGDREPSVLAGAPRRPA